MKLPMPVLFAILLAAPAAAQAPTTGAGRPPGVACPHGPTLVCGAAMDWTAAGSPDAWVAVALAAARGPTAIGVAPAAAPDRPTPTVMVGQAPQDTAAPSALRIALVAVGVGAFVTLPAAYLGFEIERATAEGNLENVGIVGAYVGASLGFAAGGLLGANLESGGRGKARTPLIMLAIGIPLSLLVPELSVAVPIAVIPAAVAAEARGT